MKNVMIVASTELEPVIVHRLSETDKVQFREVPQSVVRGYEGLFRHTYDYDELKNSLKQQVQWITKKLSNELNTDLAPDKSILRQFAYNSEKAIEDTIEYLVELSKQLDKIKEPYDRVARRRDRELEENRQQFETQEKELLRSIMLLKAKSKSLEALDPAQLKKCLSAGVVTEGNKPTLEEHLNNGSIKYQAEPLTEDSSIIFILDTLDKLEKVTNLFTVYEVEDIYEVFESGELLLVLDKNKMKSTLNSYKKDISELEKDIKQHKAEYEKVTKSINANYTTELKPVEKKYNEEYHQLLKENQHKIKAAAFIVEYLEKYSTVPVERNPVVSILYAWLDDSDVPTVQSILDELREADDLLYKIADVSGKELKEAKKEK